MLTTFSLKPHACGSILLSHFAKNVEDIGSTIPFDAELPFLGVSTRMSNGGILLHQLHYTLDLSHDHSSHISARKRNTSGEPDHFRKDPPLAPDRTNFEHQRCMKITQRIFGGLLWLSTRTRPDLASAASSAAQVLTEDTELLKVKLRHPLQYLSITQTLVLLYPYPRPREMTDLPSLVTPSLPHSGNHSQSGYSIDLSLLIGSLLGNQNLPKVLLKQNSNAMLLPLRASLPETLGFSSRNLLPLRSSCLCAVAIQLPFRR